MTGCLAVACLLCAPLALSEPDDAQQAWLDLVRVAASWQNIDGGAGWVDGPEPTRATGAAWASVRLQPAQAITVRLPAGERLRLQHAHDALPAGEFHISWSNGSGLFASLTPRVSDGGRVLEVRPPSGADSLVRVQRRADAAGPAEIVLFASHDPNRLVATSYPDTLVPRGGGRRVTLDDGGGRSDYWLTDAARPLQLDFTGPIRVRLDSRLLYPSADGPFADSYRIAVRLDGAPLRLVDLATVLETRHPVEVDGCARPIGRAAHAYLDLPPGTGRLELRVRRPMYLRARASRPLDDYLSAANQIATGGRTDGASAAARYQAAARIAQDNRHALGGAGALQSLAALAGRYPAQPQYRAMLSRRRVLHTFYRDLMPQQGSAGTASLFAWFHTPRLAPRPGVVHLPAGYAGSQVGNLASGFFDQVPAVGGRAQQYVIPEDIRSSQLRVAVDRAGQTAAASLFLQLDDDPPVRLRWDPTLRPAAAALQPGIGSAALAALQQRPQGAASTLSGAFDATRPAAPLVEAGFVEIPLQRPVRRVRVWRDDATSGPLRVALAYRSSDWFEMTEPGYLGLLAALGEGRVARLLRQALTGLATATGGSPGPPPGRPAPPGFDHPGELRNQWLPLLHLLRDRHARFAAGVENGDRRPGRSPETPAAGEQVRRRAAAAEAAGDWQLALEHWSHLAATDRPARRARAGQVRALQRLGSGFLARQLLRHDLLHVPALRDQALRGLLDMAIREQDDEALLTLRSVAAILDPGPATLGELAAALETVGHHRFALQVLLALPADQRPHETVLGAAYQLGWWQVFDAALAALDDPRRRALWQGYRAQHAGDYRTALMHWRAAGPPGARLAARLEAGEAIRQGLAAPEPGRRLQALIDWEAWQGDAPGPPRWRPLPGVARAHAGNRTLVAIARQAFGELYRATPQQPVRIGVYGPIRLRLTLRPLHSAAGRAINDWVQIVGPEGEQHVPVIDNTVSTGLHLAADSGAQPGRRIELLRDVPAGYHELEIRGARHDLLVGVAGSAARLPLTVLPRLNPYVVRQVLADQALFATTGADAERRAGSADLVPGSCGGGSIEATAAVALVGPGSGMRPITTAPSVLWFGALRRQRGDLATASDLDPGRRDLRQRLEQLLWQAEQTPRHHPALLAEAERLAEAQPDAPAIEPVLRRLRRQATWELVRSAAESAGVRLVEFSGWQPESPAMQLRKAIMGMPGGDEQLLSGHDARVLTLYNRAPVTIGLRLAVAGVGHRPLQPMRVLVAWDDGPSTEVTLSAARPEVQLLQQIGAGDHAVRLRIAEPLANQYVRIRVDERRGGHTRVIAEPVQRSYMLASRDQPLVLLQRGPARLRIDEWRDGRTRSSYRTLAAGWQRVVIPAERGRDEALLRVFRRTIASGRRPVETAQTAYRPLPVGAPLWPQTPAVALTDQPAADPFSPGRLDDATWSLIGGLTSRRTLDDEPGAGEAEQRFVSFGVAYRRHVEPAAAYYQADGTVRLHEHGSPTLALRAYVGLRRPDWPLELDLGASLFVQPNDATGDVESAATVRARIARTFRLGDRLTHRPSLSLFQRWLSLDGRPPGDATEVDQDVFTGYKRNHRRGLRLGERLQYRPWLDTRLFAGVNLVSNEDLNLLDPDHLSVDLGARQLIGDVDLGVRLKHLEYYADDDRAQDSDTQRLKLDLGFGRWLSPHRGLQAGLGYEYDTESGDASLALSLSLNRANRRYYRDFRPGDLDFRQLRQRKALEQAASEGW